MSQDVVARVEARLQKRRDRAHRERDERQAAIYHAYPELASIAAEIARLGNCSVRAALRNEDHSCYDEAMAALFEEKKKILKKNGLPTNALEMQYTCPHCKDQGVLENGKPCDCYKSLLSEELYSESDLSSVLRVQNFGTFDLNRFNPTPDKTLHISPRENMENALAESKSFIERFDDAETLNLYFYGQTGTGKTFLANCIGKELMDRGKFVVYKSAFELMEFLADSKFRRDEANENLAAKAFFNCDLLIIDDLGTEFVNEFTRTALFNVLNSRLNHKRKMIISTNLSLLDVKRIYTERISSRINEHFLRLRFFGDDLRVM